MTSDPHDDGLREDRTVFEQRVDAAFAAMCRHLDLRPERMPTECVLEESYMIADMLNAADEVALRDVPPNALRDEPDPKPWQERENLLADAAMAGWGFVPFSVRYRAAKAAGAIVQSWFDGGVDEVPVEPPEPSEAETRAALKAWRDAGNGGVDHGAAMIAALRAAAAVRSSVPADNPQGES